MKKITIVSSAVTILAIAWLGSTWYTGKLLADEYPKYIERANKEFQALNNQSNEEFPYKVQFISEQYDKHFFSTEIKDKVVITNTQDNTVYSIPIHSKIENGPLPLSRLLSFKLMPVMASGSSEIVNDPSIKWLFDITNGQAPIKSDFSMSYGKQIKQLIHIAALNYVDKEKNLEVKIDAFTVNSDTDLSGVGKINSTIPNIALKSTDGDTTVVNVKNTTVNIDQTPTKYAYINAGKQEVKMGNLTISELNDNGETNNSVSLDDLQTTSTVNVKDNIADISLNVTFGNLNVDKQQLGQFTFNIDLNHLDADTINKLIELVRTTGINQQNEQVLNELVKTIYTNQPEIIINPIGLVNSKGESKFTANIQLAKINLDTNIFLNRDILAQYNHLDITASITKPSLIDTVTSLNIINGDTPEDALNSATKLVDEILNERVQRGILSSKDNSNYRMEIKKLNNGELKVNDKVIPKENVNRFILGSATGMY